MLLRAVFSLSLLILFAAVVPRGATAAGSDELSLI